MFADPKKQMIPVNRMSSNNNDSAYSENNRETNSVVSNNANNNGNAVTDLVSKLRAGTVESLEQFAEEEGLTIEEAVDYESVFGRTPIIVSAMEGHPELVAYLIENEANLNRKDSKGKTALIYAVEKGDEAIVKLLVEGGADVNPKYPIQGENALLIAIQTGQLGIAAFLLDNGSNPNSSDVAGHTALVSALELHSDIGFVELLLKKGANPNVIVNAKTALMNAVELDTTGDLVRLLLMNGADPNIGFYSRSALTMAFEFDNKNAILMMLPRVRTVPNIVFPYALEYAERTNDFELLSHLPRGACEAFAGSYEGGIALKDAIGYGQVSTVDYLLDLRPTIPQREIQDLLFSVVNSPFKTYTPILDTLLKRGGDINARDENMNTLLHIAAQRDYETLVKFLVEKGADKTIKNRFGKTAIHITDKLAVKRILSPPWKGFDRSDLEVFVGSFDLEVTDQMRREGRKASAYSFSVCPVCLEIRPREEGCDYMDHNCNESEGKEVLFPTKVYDTYKCTDASLDNKLGKIFWCVICNRICENHKHFRLGKMEEAKPWTVNVQITEHAQHFVDDCRSIGGGGIREKVARFAALRREAIALQPLVGTISEYEAKERLARAFWDAPLIPGALEEADRIITEKRFFDSLDVFPSTANAVRATATASVVVEVETNAPDVPYPGATGPPEDNFPTVKDYDDEKNVVELNHKNKDGTVVHHKHDAYEAFELPEFMNYVRTTTTESERSAGAQFGFCPFKPCEARLYPQEIAKALELAKDVSAEDRAQYEAILLAYKKRFNKKFRYAMGGKRRKTIRRSKNRKSRRGPSKKRTTRKHA